MPQITLCPPENVLSHDRMSKSLESINRRITQESLSKSMFSNGEPCVCVSSVEFVQKFEVSYCTPGFGTI